MERQLPKLYVSLSTATTELTDKNHLGYKNNETGRVNAIWPGSSLHYQQVIDQPRYEDFDIRSFHENPWACLGMGWTIQDRKGPKEADVSPHLGLQEIDPKWWESIKNENGSNGVSDSNR